MCSKMLIHLILLMTIVVTQAQDLPEEIKKISEFHGSLGGREICWPIEAKNIGEKVEINIWVEKLFTQQSDFRAYDGNRKLISVRYDLVGDHGPHMAAGLLLPAPQIFLERYRSKHLEICLINVSRVRGARVRATEFRIQIIQHQYQ